MAIQEEIKITTVIDTGESKTTIRDLRKEVKGYTDDLANLEQGTTEYNRILENLATTQSRISNIQRDVRASTLNLTDRYAVLTRTLGGIVGGFNSVVGVVTLLGGESENLVNTLTRLQAGFAIVQGLQAFSTAIKNARLAMIAFNSTVNANPIAFLASGITLALGLLAKFSISLADNTTKLYDAKAATEAFNTALSATNSILETNLRYAKAAGASTDELISIQISSTKEQLRLSNQRIKSLEEENDSLDFYFKYGSVLQKKQATERRDQIEEEIKVEKERIDTILTQLKEFDEERNALAIARGTELRKERTEQTEINSKSLNETKDYTDEINKAEDRLYGNREKRREKLEFENASEDEQLRLLRLQKTATDDLVESLKERLEIEENPETRLRLTEQLIDAESEQIERTIELGEVEEEVGNKRIELENQLRIAQGFEEGVTLEEIEALKEEAHQNEIDRLWEVATDTEASYGERIAALIAWNKEQENVLKDEKKRKKEEKDLRREALQNTASFLSTSSQLFSDNAVAAKALGVASATIATYTGASQVLGDPSLPFYAKIAAVASILSTGALNVKNAVSTKIPGASDSATADVQQQIPSFPDLQNEIVETHNNLSAIDESIYNSSQRVYVVESDISETQNRVRVSESESTFG